MLSLYYLASRKKKEPGRDRPKLDEARTWSTSPNFAKADLSSSSVRVNVKFRRNSLPVARIFSETF